MHTRAFLDAAFPQQHSGDGRGATVQALRERIRAMQGTGLGVRTLPTLEVLRPVLPGGALRQGAAYAVPDSTTLALMLAAGPAAAGGWCGVVGVPEFGVEAAVLAGLDLGRLVLVPSPGGHWLTVAAQLADVLPVVLLRPPAVPSAGDAARLASRLRQRGAVLVVLGAWPGAEATLSVERRRPIGVGAGSGLLAGHELTVAVTTGDGRVARHVLRLVDERLLPPGERADAHPAPAAATPTAALRDAAVRSPARRAG